MTSCARASERTPSTQCKKALLRSRAFLFARFSQRPGAAPLTAAWCGAAIVLFRLVNPSAAERAWNAQASAQESRGISVRATSSRMVRREAEEHMA